MSTLTKNEISLEKVPKSSFRNNKQNIKDNIRFANSPYIKGNKIGGKNINENASYYKKVCLKPFKQSKKDFLTTVIKNKNNDKTNLNKYIKFNNHKLESKVNFTNNDIYINSENKNIIHNNNRTLNIINPELLAIDKLKKIHYNKKNNNDTCNKKEKFFYKKILPINNNKYYEKGRAINSEDKSCRNKTDLINDLNLEFVDKEREKVNINYINTISNNVYGKINSPIYFNKIFSLSNTMNDNFNICNEMSNTDSLARISKRKINKKLKKKILLNDTNLNKDINKTNGEIEPKYDYFNSMTEINQNSKIEEIDIYTYKYNNEKKTERKKKMNFIENKKRIISSIEREKKKLINQNYKNYIKYITLIQKQQQEYKEYDKYLKNELKKNRNSQIKLLLFKENYFNIFKNKNNKLKGTGNIPKEFKALSSENFVKPKFANKINKKKIFSFNTYKIELNKKSRYMEKSEPSLKTENSINSIRLSKNRNEKFNNKKLIKINIDELKRKHTINLNKKINKKIKFENTMKDNISSNNFGKNITNKSHLYINSRSLIPLDKSYNYEFSNFSKEDISKKDKKIKLNFFSDSKKIKTDIRQFDRSKNKFNINNEQKSLILKNLVKNIKNEIEKKIESNKSSINDMNFKKHSKSKSMKKIEELSEYYYGTNLTNNNTSKQMHKMISEEKYKILNNLSEKKPTYMKMKNGIYFSSLKHK